MWLLTIALVATVLGPSIYQFISRNKSTKEGLDSFIMVVTAGIIIFQVLPATFESLGVWSILLALLGALVPSVIEFLFRSAAQKTHLLTLFLGILGLMIHGVIDGSALRMTPNMEESFLPLAILLHRVPISLTLWWLIKPEFGTKITVAVLVTLVLGTVLGFWYSSILMSSLSSQSFAGFQAIVAGTLLHVLYHRPGHSHSDTDGNEKHTHNRLGLTKGTITGAIVALTILIFLQQIHHIHN